MRLVKLLSISLICLFITGLAFGQGVGASGDIKGTVTDPSGAIVSSATITVTDVGKGIKRTGTSDSSGEFRITGLAPATYSVSVSKSGFQSEIAKAVVVTIGQTSTVDFHLKLSQVSEQIEVTTAPPAVETDRAQQSNVITEQYIQDLPINRRDYLTFTLLAPAVSDSTRLASDQDFRVKQTPQSGLSFYGSNGRGNSVTVDGGEANDDAGGVRTNMGQDAVQEFQINRSNYNAELGGASGATVNIVTRSGTNITHGTLFGFFRNDAMDAANPFSVTQALKPGEIFNPAGADITGKHVKDSLTREQFGGSIGFPITKGKTFLFGNFEGLMQDAQNAVPLLTSTAALRSTAGQNAIIAGLAGLGATPVPCRTGAPALPAATCAAILTSSLNLTNSVPSAMSTFVVNQLESNGGILPYTTRQYLASSRFDHQFSDRNQVFLRYNFGHDHEENPDVQSLVGFSRGSSIHTYDNTLLGAWFHQFSSTTLNELRLQYNYNDFNVIPNAPGEIGLDMPGIASLGTNIFLPSLTIMRRYEAADNLSLVRGKHTFKFGAYELIRGNHTESHTFFPGRFNSGLPAGAFSPCLQVPAACGLAGTIQPTTMSSLQMAANGMMASYQQGFGSPTYSYTRPFTSAYAQDTWSAAPNLTLNLGVRYELDSQPDVLNTSYKDFAPRVSFAWDPFKDKKTVVRGGYGIFYSPIYGQISNVVKTLGLVNGFQQIAQVLVTFPNTLPIYANLFAGGKIQCTTPAAGQAACVTPTDIAPIAIKHDGTAPLSVFFSGQPDYRNPYAQQAEFGIDREIGHGFSVSLSAIYVHTIGLPTAIDKNPLPTAPVVSVPLANGATASFKQWSPAFFARPLVLQDNVYSSKGAALYEGGIVEVKKTMSHHFSVFGSYTLSKSFDTSTDFNSDFGPADNTNLAGERGLSNFDQRHKFVALALIDGGSPGSGNKLLSGFQLAPIFRYNSGHPFNLLAGSDVNADRHSTNDRPIGVARNSGLGPNFMSFDMRLTKRIKMNERSELQILVEGFNLANRTNYGSVNNVVGAGFLQPTTAAGGQGNLTANVHGHVVDPAVTPVTTPLAFTSALPKRQIQFGLRAAF